MHNFRLLLRWAIWSVTVSRSLAAAVEPIVFAPSTYWSGNDGPWSSFGVQVGTPAQNLLVLPSTGGSSLWVVLPEGCTEEDPSTCGEDRGNLLMIDQSSTWETKGLYELGLPEEQPLGYSGNSLVGHDIVIPAWQGDGLPSLNRSVVVGIATKDFFLGSLGLSVWPENFTTYNDPQPSMLGALRNASLIPSASWGYTAGAVNRRPTTFGSLTLGGYDASQFESSDLDTRFNFHQDIARPFTVAVNSITTSTTKTLSQNPGFYALINSRVPYMWLPRSVCTAFEEAFGLQWDNATSFYLVNDTQREQLLALNASVTFTLAQTTSNSTTTTITMPYSDFDLTLGYPLADLQPDETKHYFPLKRADNDTQYTLGRVFLQSAYLIADYDRGTFTVAQVKHFDPGAHRRIVAIRPPGEEEEKSGGGGVLSKGAIAGIGVAGAVVLAALIGWYNWRRRRWFKEHVGQLLAAHHQDPSHLEAPMDVKPEMDGTGMVRPEADSNLVWEKKPLYQPVVSATELETPRDPGAAELETPRGPGAAELGGGGAYRAELDGPAAVVYEMPAQETNFAELPTEYGSKPADTRTR